MVTDVAQQTNEGRGTMNWDHIEAKCKKLAATFAILTMCAAVTPAFAMKTDLGPTTKEPLFDQAIRGQCVPSAAKDILRSYGLKIANAPTVEEARALILSQTGLARKALSTASWLLPFSSSVREARDKIGNLENRVYAANTQTEVARDFSEFLAVPTDSEDAKVVDQNETPDSSLMNEEESSLMVLAQEDLNQPAVDVSAGGGGGCHYTTGEVIIIILGFLLFIIPGIIFLVIFC
jgi:hypothetical protein